MCWRALSAACWLNPGFNLIRSPRFGSRFGSTARLRTARVPMRVIGLTGGDALAITGERAIPVPTLSERFESWLPAYMAGNLQN